jgi:hypothetical protein
MPDEQMSRFIFRHEIPQTPTERAIDLMRWQWLGVSKPAWFGAATGDGNGIEGEGQKEDGWVAWENPKPGQGGDAAQAVKSQG